MADEQLHRRGKKRKGASLHSGYTKQQRLEVTATGPSLELIPDNVLLRIMTLLDMPSLMSIAKVNRRFYLLHSDELIWSDVDLSTLPKLNVQRLKVIINRKLHPSLWRLTIKSNAAECQANSKLRPIINSGTMDELFRRCPRICIIKLVNIDITKISQQCLLWSSHFERVTFSRCIAPFKWVDTFRPCWLKLKQLYLPNTSKTSDHDLQHLASLQKEHKFQLSHMSLRNCYRITKTGMQALCTSFPNLVLLDLAHCRSITQESLFLVAGHLTCLRELSIEGSVIVDYAADFLLKLQENCHQLKLLNVFPEQLKFHDIFEPDHLSFDIKYV